MHRLQRRAPGPWPVPAVPVPTPPSAAATQLTASLCLKPTRWCRTAAQRRRTRDQRAGDLTPWLGDRCPGRWLRRRPTCTPAHPGFAESRHRNTVQAEGQTLQRRLVRVACSVQATIGPPHEPPHRKPYLRQTARLPVGGADRSRAVPRPVATGRARRAAPSPPPPRSRPTGKRSSAAVVGPARSKSIDETRPALGCASRPPPLQGRMSSSEMSSA